VSSQSERRAKGLSSRLDEKAESILARPERGNSLGPFGPESALRDYGLRLAQDGTAKAKKRALVAVARKLAVLLLTLWKSQQPYEPFPRWREQV
jgi:hypothetical protein